MLTMLLPTTLPSATSLLPEMPDPTLTANSGALVPNATTVSPMITGWIPSVKPRLQRPSPGTPRRATRQIRVRPPTQRSSRHSRRFTIWAACPDRPCACQPLTSDASAQTAATNPIPANTALRTTGRTLEVRVVELLRRRLDDGQQIADEQGATEGQRAATRGDLHRGTSPQDACSVAAVRRSMLRPCHRGGVISRHPQSGATGRRRIRRVHPRRRVAAHAADLQRRPGHRRLRQCAVHVDVGGDGHRTGEPRHRRLLAVRRGRHPAAHPGRRIRHHDDRVGARARRARPRRVYANGCSPRPRSAPSTSATCDNSSLAIAKITLVGRRNAWPSSCSCGSGVGATRTARSARPTPGVPLRRRVQQRRPLAVLRQPRAVRRRPGRRVRHLVPGSSSADSASRSSSRCCAERARRTLGSRRRLGWSLHTKITLLTTAALLVVRAGRGHRVRVDQPGDARAARHRSTSCWPGWFQGVTPRTAGFNTVDIGALNEPTQLVITTLMFIGAGSASTARRHQGHDVRGPRLRAVVRGPRQARDVNAFRRRIPIEPHPSGAHGRPCCPSASSSARRLLLMSIEDLTLMPALFEVTSAFGTVGLSTGITHRLWESRDSSCSSS